MLTFDVVLARVGPTTRRSLSPGHRMPCFAVDDEAQNSRTQNAPTSLRNPPWRPDRIRSPLVITAASHCVPSRSDRLQLSQTGKQHNISSTPTFHNAMRLVFHATTSFTHFHTVAVSNESEARLLPIKSDASLFRTAHNVKSIQN